MSRQKRYRKRFRVDARNFEPEKALKSLTQMYKPANKLPEAPPILKYSTKKKEK